MYTVMLLDDEPWALESLFRVFSWQENGFEVIGRFQNSVEGWEAIRTQMPDVVFADIRMPEISGLEIAERARSLARPPLFVVVSGYNEFEYAQRALHLGVFGYCLKPIAQANAQGFLMKLKAALEKKYIERSVALLEAIIEGLSAQELFHRMGKTLTGDYWCVAALRDVEKQAQEDLILALEALNTCTIYRACSRIIVVANGSEQVGAQLETAMKTFQQERKAFIGLSRTSSHALHLVRRLFEAQSCSYMNFLNAEISMATYRAKEEQHIQNCVDELVDAVLRGDAALWMEKQLEYADALARGEVQMHSVCRFWNRLMDAFYTSGSDALRDELEWVTDPEEMVNLFKNKQEMMRYLNGLMDSRLDGGANPDGVSANQGFSDMVDYVRDHYTEKIRLSDLAKRFHLNMTYCSEMFHKAAGVTYTEYLNKLRMEHAKRAILGENCDLQALAMELGYNDYVTFSKSFKKYFGQAPSRFEGTK